MNSDPDKAMRPEAGAGGERRRSLEESEPPERVHASGEQPELSAAVPVRLTLAAVRFRNGQMVLRAVLSREREQLLRAGFHPTILSLASDSGAITEADLWAQEDPSLCDMLNAAILVFQDEPGSLSWR